MRTLSASYGQREEEEGRRDGGVIAERGQSDRDEKRGR